MLAGGTRVGNVVRMLRPPGSTTTETPASRRAGSTSSRNRSTPLPSRHSHAPRPPQRRPPPPGAMSPPPPPSAPRRYRSSPPGRRGRPPDLPEPTDEARRRCPAPGSCRRHSLVGERRDPPRRRGGPAEMNARLADLDSDVDNLPRHASGLRSEVREIGGRLRNVEIPFAKGLPAVADARTRRHPGGRPRRVLPGQPRGPGSQLLRPHTCAPRPRSLRRLSGGNAPGRYRDRDAHRCNRGPSPP